MDKYEWFFSISYSSLPSLHIYIKLYAYNLLQLVNIIIKFHLHT